MRLTFLILVTLFIGSSCSNGRERANQSSNESPRIPRKTNVLSPSPDEIFTIGDEVTFQITSKTDVDSIVFDDDQSTVAYDTISFNWNSLEAATGRKRFKVTVYFEGKSETHFPRIRLRSDITPKSLGYKLIETYPHDPEAYTQGLFFMNDLLFESTGRTGRSSIRKVNLDDGRIIKQINIDSQYFGEGSTYWKDKIIMLTYRSNTGFVFDKDLNQTGSFRYDHEGWGITTFGDTLIVSDGTEVLRLLDPRDFSEIGRLQVYDQEGPIKSLNELEHIDGLIYANVYTEDYIVVVDPSSGKVLQKIDLSGLLSDEQKSKLDPVNDVLNGIAYHEASGKIYVTGKNWPSLFEVSFTEL